MKRRDFLESLCALAVTASVPLPEIAQAAAKEVGMSASLLPLPVGLDWARYVENGKMRELRAYMIGSDCFLFRWDTLIRGEQYHINAEMITDDNNETSEQFAAKYRKIALEMFQNIERKA